MDKKLGDRINALAKKAKTEGLTKEEEAERDALRKTYLEEFRKGFIQTLEHTYVETPDGVRTPLKSAIAEEREEEKIEKEEAAEKATENGESSSKPC